MRKTTKPTHRLFAAKAPIVPRYAYGKPHLMQLMSELFNEGVITIIVRKTKKQERNDLSLLNG